MNIFSMFETPVWSSSLDNFDEIKDQIVSFLKQFESQNQNNNQRYFLNGYQSPRQILQQREELISLFDYSIDVAEKATIDLSFVPSICYISDAWVNISKSSSDVLFDTTQRDTFTALFFVKAPPNSGNVFLSNPGANLSWQGNTLVQNKNKYNSQKVHIPQEEGKLYVFPSHIPYGIEPNNHNEETICVVMTIVAIPEEVVKQNNGNQYT
jgi:hypothetical protein